MFTSEKQFKFFENTTKTICHAAEERPKSRRLYGRMTQVHFIWTHAVLLYQHRCDTHAKHAECVTLAIIYRNIFSYEYLLSVVASLYFYQCLISIQCY